MQTKLFIGGEFVDGLAGGTIEVINPFDQTKLADVAEARAEDIDRAVDAAARAFPAWSRTSASERGRLLLALASAVEANAARIAELVRDVGFPPGVVNIVPGYGATAGQRLAEHDRVAKVTFTGSTVTGRKIIQASAGNLKKLQLELGGKGPNIVFEDAELPAAVAGSAFAIFHNQGQACIAGSRLLLHESIAGAFLDAFLALAASIRLGDPL